ncbi:hypothetical protein [Sphingobium yanoikuyae]
MAEGTNTSGGIRPLVSPTEAQHDCGVAIAQAVNAKLAERGSPHWVEAAHDGVIVQAIAHHCLTEQAELVEALRRLRTTAVLLLNHGEGCAMNHYGDDWQGVMPGWLVDCRKDVLAAAKVLDKFATRPADLMGTGM